MIAIDSETAGGDIALKWAFWIFFVPMFIGLLVLASHALSKKPSIVIKLLRVAGAFIFSAAFSYVSLEAGGNWNNEENAYPIGHLCSG